MTATSEPLLVSIFVEISPACTCAHGACALTRHACSSMTSDKTIGRFLSCVGCMRMVMTKEQRESIFTDPIWDKCMCHITLCHVCEYLGNKARTAVDAYTNPNSSKVMFLNMDLVLKSDQLAKACDMMGTKMYSVRHFEKVTVVSRKSIIIHNLPAGTWINSGDTSEKLDPRKVRDAVPEYGVLKHAVDHDTGPAVTRRATTYQDRNHDHQQLHQRHHQRTRLQVRSV